MFLTHVTLGIERRRHCLISEPDILSQLHSHDHKGGLLPHIRLQTVAPTFRGLHSL